MNQLIYDLLNFFFPVYCPVCGTPMSVRKLVLCLPCELKMPLAGYASNPENPVAQLFWGRTKIEAATSFFRFEKGSKYQKLLHLLKYKGEKNVGVFLGKLLGTELKETPFGQCDYIVPVPLHPKKMRKRGYNQSEIIATGLSSILEIPVITNILYRTSFTGTQTKKTRFERFLNVEHVFTLNEQGIRKENCSILLIDDVVTTGSTLEACVETLLQKEGVKVYVATVACA